MLSHPPIFRYKLFLGNLGLSSVIHKWGKKATNVTEHLDPDVFLKILREMEESMTHTRETFEARSMMQSLIQSHKTIDYSRLDNAAIKIIRANFVLDLELMKMMEQVIPDFNEHFLGQASEESSDNS